ncbi:hypothetical protein SELMODRAFT_417558 [Selaginella moellendorffii]|uniref:Calcineurin-like phosphoesterase domain-containing protein n=1 Tax=Selaginella moellendorffii TaxID=88036 RepID=D8S2V0_SELML|nr:hypothetical protein SELMODRAFT_417558 [Selaginella moellendorffii]
MADLVRIAVVGDVHGDWDATADRRALQHLNPDIVLFTGDFGDEDVQIVREVAKLDMSKAVILGNHDCCRSALGGNIDLLYEKLTTSYLERLVGYLVSFFKRPSKPAVEQQIQMLGDSFVGFKRVDYRHLKLSVVGARPFAMGGDGVYGKTLLSPLFGISDLKGSAEKIKELILDAPKDHSVVILAHNGPTGLGSESHDICGKDFSGRGGDNGDPDLAEAIKLCEEECEIPLVVFGHMHRNEGRKMVAALNRKVFVNGAVVPRREGLNRQFTMVELRDHEVKRVTETWVKVAAGDVCIATMELELLSNRFFHMELKLLELQLLSTTSAMELQLLSIRFLLQLWSSSF